MYSVFKHTQVRTLFLYSKSSQTSDSGSSLLTKVNTQELPLSYLANKRLLVALLLSLIVTQERKGKDALTPLGWAMLVRAIHVGEFILEE